MIGLTIRQVLEHVLRAVEVEHRPVVQPDRGDPGRIGRDEHAAHRTTVLLPRRRYFCRGREDRAAREPGKLDKQQPAYSFIHYPQVHEAIRPS